MSNHSKKGAITAYLTLLGNPYAKLSVLDDFDSLDLALREPTDAEREYAQLQGNQYTLLSVAISDSQQAGPSFAGSNLDREVPERTTLSKVDFVAECTRVFRPYIPAAEKGRLRRHHRDFITRNKNHPGRVRYALIKELRKYDLAGLPGISAQFNRERDLMTDQKLKQIERSVLFGEKQ
jgi:hypothetical protein